MTNDKKGKSMEEICIKCLKSYKARSLCPVCRKNIEAAAREEERKRIVAILEEMKERVWEAHEKTKRIAPQSYGHGVEWGAFDTCCELLEAISPQSRECECGAGKADG
jgi:uncharacterized protein (UPF0212 family)